MEAYIEHSGWALLYPEHILYTLNTSTTAVKPLTQCSTVNQVRIWQLSLTYPEGVGGLLKHHHKLELIHLFVGYAALCNMSLHRFECLMYSLFDPIYIRITT
jgi:hypothetical protein